jgi:hypothetical protein
LSFYIILKYIWWGFREDKKMNFTLKSWDSIDAPKFAGKLCWTKMIDINTTLKAKLGWLR